MHEDVACESQKSLGGASDNGNTLLRMHSNSEFQNPQAHDTLGLFVTQRVAYIVTTKCKHSDAVADYLIN